MTQVPPIAGTGGSTRAIHLLLGAAASLAFLGAVVVFLFGVILTAGVYRSRLAWLLGVVLPLLVLGALFARLAANIGGSIGAGSATGHMVTSERLRRFSVICLALVAVPFALAGLLLFVYGVAFVLFGVIAGVHWLIH